MKRDEGGVINGPFEDVLRDATGASQLEHQEQVKKKSGTQS
jgi:hypothetical protein